MPIVRGAVWRRDDGGARVRRGNGLGNKRSDYPNPHCQRSGCRERRAAPAHRSSYQLPLWQARAQVAALKAQIALTGRQVLSQGSGVNAAESQVEKAREQLAYARATRERLEPLVAPGFVTHQQLDEARTNQATCNPKR
jgi:hypothetical protein